MGFTRHVTNAKIQDLGRPRWPACLCASAAMNYCLAFFSHVLPVNSCLYYALFPIAPQPRFRYHCLLCPSLSLLLWENGKAYHVHQQNTDAHLDRVSETQAGFREKILTCLRKLECDQSE